MAKGVGHLPEIILAVLTMFMAYLAIRSGTRHRINWFYSTVISSVAYSLVFYILGFSLSAHPSRDNESSASLACSALLLVGLAKSIVSHIIPDGRKTLSTSSYEQLLQMVFVLVLISPTLSCVDSELFGTLVSAVFLHWLGQLQARLLSASARSSTKDDLLISEYMSKKSYKQNLDPMDFRDLNYIVSGEVSARDSYLFLLKHVAMGLRRKWYIPDLGIGACIPGTVFNPVISYETLVTIGDIWKHIDSSESRDICLSFALFKLLRRRFRGCYLHESGHDSTRQLFFRGLLSSQSENPLRAFHIIEAELGFLFDFFYNSHLPPYTVFYTALTSYAAYLTILHSGDDAPLPSFIVLFFPLLGLLPLVSSLISNREKVNIVVNICRRRKRSSSSRPYTNIAHLLLFLWRYCVLLLLMGISRIGTKYLWLDQMINYKWSNRAGQYSLFHGDYRGFTTCQISAKAKEALLNALRCCSDGKLSDGRCSLSRNEAQALGWACDQEFVAEKILVWHIATTLCRFGQQSRKQIRVPVLHFRGVQSKEKMSATLTRARDNYQVATMLSDYCAYLVGFVPELVADDIYATRLVFDNGRAAAVERLQGEGSLATMYQSAAMMDLGGTDFTLTAQQDVVFKGKMLAAQLIRLPDDIQWKVLAEFWAELMLFVSPSHNSAAHLERLKDGGELITHIWALLTHVGILERPSGRDHHTAANQTRVDTSIRGEATTSVPAQTEIEVVIEGSSYY